MGGSISTYCVSVTVDGEIRVYVSAENAEEAKGKATYEVSRMAEYGTYIDAWHVDKVDE